MSTHIKIASVTVGVGGASSIDFTSISQVYKDLVIKISSRISDLQVSHEVRLRFNNDTGTNYGIVRFFGSGTTVTSQNTTSLGGTYNTFIAACQTSAGSSTANVFGNGEIYIPNYTNNKFKAVSGNSVTENNATQAFIMLISGIWNNTTAISTISLLPQAGTFVQHSTATLYGIA